MASDTWSRVAKSDGVSEQGNRILTDFNDSAPWKSVPALIGLRKKLRGLGDESWVKEKLADQGLTMVPQTPDEFRGYIAAETAKWTKVIKDAGVQISK